MNWFSRPVSDTQIPRRKRLWLYAAAAAVMFFLAAPTLIVVPMSFSESQYLEFPPRVWSVLWYEHYFNSRAWLSATATSLQAAFLTALLATPLGVMAAYGLAADGGRRGKFVFLLLISPMMVPVILAGIGIFYVYVKLNLNNTLTGLVLAHSVLALPLVVIVAAAGLKNFDMNQERVARSLGASRLRAFCTVTLPQIRFSVISAALLAFLTSFDEVIVALFIAGGDNSTITRAMFLALRDQIDPTIASVSTLMIILTSLMLAAAQIFGKKPDS
ncbi:MAG: ABC transporter permease [Gammaproteobacteria bacterium]